MWYSRDRSNHQGVFYQSYPSLSVIIIFKEKEISDLSTDFGGRTQNNGKINFGMLRSKIMKELLHWVQYYYCTSVNPSIIDSEKLVYIQQLYTDLHRA